MSTCAIGDCGLKVFARGWCSKHYTRWRRNGDPLAFKPRPSATDRFWAKVDKRDDGCWLWTGVRNWGGYGFFYVDANCFGKAAHRFAYETEIGPIPEGLQLDHLCRNRQCVNPAHLEPVTQQENIRRGNGGAHWAAKTHCPKGHPYEGDNVYINPKGSRECKACRREAQNRFHSKVA